MGYRNRSRFGVLSLLLVLGMLAELAIAEKRPLPAHIKLRNATDVVVGKVQTIYERKEQEAFYLRTRFVAEVLVKTVEKGDSNAQGQLLYVRYWRRKWTGEGSPSPGTSGHAPIPNEGDNVRIYLARNSADGFSRENSDGGYNVLGSDGFEILEPSGALSTVETPDLANEEGK